MILNKDITGMASRIEYAKKGDQVKVVPTDAWNEMILVEKDDRKFWVFPEDLEQGKEVENE